MSDRHDPALDTCLVQWVSAGLAGEEISSLSLAPEDIPSFLDLAYQNRVEGFLFPALSRLSGTQFPEDQLAALRSQYHHRLVQGFGQLKAGTDLLTALEKEGIPGLGMRGPFAALDAFQDVAARRFFDLDLLVPRSQARPALRLAEKMGHQRSTPELPVGFFLRHHLHWQLMHREAGVVTDLHWAIDHPYTLYRINYDDIFARRECVEHSGLSWHQPGPEHQVLISCIHLCKHLPEARSQVQQPQAMAAISREGQLSHWLDIAILFQRYQAVLDWDALWQTAADWHAAEAVAAGMEGTALLAPGLVPPAWSSIREQWLQSGDLTPTPSTETVKTPAVPSRFLITLSRWGGFRASRVSDFWTFIKPPDSYFDNRKGMALTWRRWRHALLARLRILFAAVDGIVCGLWAMLTGPIKKRLH